MKFSSNASLIFSPRFFSPRAERRSSDEEHVRALIDGVETAAEARDASDVLEHVADDYADSQGFDKSAAPEFPARLFSRASRSSNCW